MLKQYESVEEYLQEKRQQAVENAKKERNDLLLRENLVKRIYASGPNVNTQEYPYTDANGKRYKLQYLPITDAQYEEVKKYADMQTSSSDTGSSGNIGGKIKGIAVFSAIILAIFFIVFGVTTLEAGLTTGIWFLIGGSIFAWITGCMLYGFGQLVENSDKLVALKQREKNEQNACEAHEQVHEQVHEQAGDAKTLR